MMCDTESIPRRFRGVPRVRLLSGAALLALVAQASGSMPIAPVRPIRATVAPRLPLSFEANQGQTDPRVKFLARGPGYTLFLTPTEAVLSLSPPAAAPSDLPERALRVRLVGADANAGIEGVDQLPGRSNYFIGRDPGRWRTGVPHYERVRLHDVYPGVDQVFHAAGGQLEYDLVVAPGADPSRIRVAFDGADTIRLNDGGDLVLTVGGEEVEQPAPLVYQEIAGSRRVVSARHVVTAPGEIGFEIGGYDASRPLVIDPVLVYSTYLGGSDNDRGYAIAVDAVGSAYIVGSTRSADFPTVNSLYPLREVEAFVAKLDPSGSQLVYSTYLGGSSEDIGFALAVDAAGNAYVTGYTRSMDFPAVSPAQTYGGGPADAFVAKLNVAGSALLYSTFFGGDAYDEGRGIAVDAAGRAHLTGMTSSSNFPVVNPVQSTRGDSGTPASDAFVARLNTAGTAAEFSTYLGGSSGDRGNGIGVDAAGNTYVAGYSQSANFPTVNAWQSTLGGTSDAFVAKFTADGRSLAYSTYLGGRGGEEASAIAVDAAGVAYITGGTGSDDFPTARPLQPINGKATLYKTTDGGQNWNPSGLENKGVSSLAIARANPSVLYAAAGAGVFTSADGGEHWRAVNSGLPSYIGSVAVDPVNPRIAYAGGAGLFKSSDGGDNWSAVPIPAGLPNPSVGHLTFDSTIPGTLYAARPRQLIKTPDGGATWTAGNVPSDVVASIAVDPSNPSTVYIGTFDDDSDGSGLWKSVDGGQSFTLASRGLFTPPARMPSIPAVAIDPVNTSILYAAAALKVFKSTNAGADWAPSGMAGFEVTALAIDPTNSSVIYAGTIRDGVFKSTNAGATWTAVNRGLFNLRVNTLTFPFGSSSVLYAGTNSGGADAFLTKLTADGSALVYSTYLGGEGDDRGLSVAIDLAGRAYVTGSTTSTTFPTAQPTQAALGGASDAFVAKFDASGAALLFSTFLGGSGDETGYGIAIDASGHAYVTGRTASSNFPTVSAFQPTDRPADDGFVAKINTTSSSSRVSQSGAALTAPRSPELPPQPASSQTFATPDGVRFRVETMATNLDVPWAMSFAPDGRLFVTERLGRVRIFDAALRSSTVALMIDDVYAQDEAGLLGLALDADFARNRFVYLYYTATAGGAVANRVVRFRENSGKLIERVILLDNIPAGSIHNGGRLRVGPDGLLYITTGDAGAASLAQDLGSLAGKILRLNRDGTTPRANPFGSPILSVGHRNPQGIDWHPATGELWSTEHGAAGNDEVNVIQGGVDYGWPRIEGGQEMPGMQSPLAFNSTATAPSGGSFYRGQRFGGFASDFFVATLRGRDLLRIRPDAGSPRRIVSQERLLDGRFGRIRDVISGPDGFLYFLTNNRDGRDATTDADDRLLRIVPVPQ